MNGDKLLPLYSWSNLNQTGPTATVSELQDTADELTGGISLVGQIGAPEPHPRGLSDLAVTLSDRSRVAVM